MASTMSNNPNPTTPPYQDPLAYAEAYLSIHTMSPPSYRYAYLLWFSIILVFLIYSLLHWTGKRGGAVGALWSKWTLRRRTWRKKHALEAARRNPAAHRQPYSFPSNAQLLSFSVLAIISLCACFVGPDYIAPSAKLWQFNPSSDALIQPNQLNSSPAYTIQKAWWTVGGRAGIISFALFPLVVLFALKAPPFALLSLPFFLQLHFDKLSYVHRWSGVLLWIITTIHVATWAVQLARDKRVGVDDQPLWVFVWFYNKFIYGCIAYFCLTLSVLLSLPVVRAAYYEAFYALHILLVPLAIAMSGFHFPRIGWWCWVSLALWGGERIWRFIRFGWINGYFFRPPKRASPEQSWELDGGPQRNQFSSNHTSTYSEQFDFSIYAETGNAHLPDSSSAFQNSPGNVSIPPSYGWAHLLPGRTIRLKVVTPRPFQWSPGQHVLLRVPSVSKFTTHPFTIASISRIQQSGSSSYDHIVELLIRAKGGFTRDLWNEVYRLSNLPRIEAPLQPTVGALLKVQLDGPFGSVSRTRWGEFSTILIVCGGSGVCFGVAVLEFLCLCMLGHSPSTLGSSPGGLGYSDFRTRRIRFVWLVREYSHLQWCAAALWRCLKLLPSDALEVNIFVTNISRSVRQRHGDFKSPDQSNLEPPTPGFARGHAKSSSWASGFTLDSDDEHNLPVTPTSAIYSGPEETNSHPLDLTNFDGDDDSFMPGEAQLSYQVHKVGNLRRRETRRRKATSSNKKGVRLVTDSLEGAGQSSLPLLSGSSSHEPFNPYMSGDRRTNVETYSLMSRNSTSTMDQGMQLSQETASLHMQIESEDSRALMVISEMARSGKPQLNTILTHEVESSQGAVAVACCGPTSLTALVRKIVAAKNDPGRVRSGDPRGSIALVSEDFGY